MSNKERAAEVAAEFLGGNVFAATIITKRRADAGLLAPDLPEPRIDIDGWQEWGHKHGNSVTLNNGMVTVEMPDDISRDLTPDEARELAAWLNDAADYPQEGR